MPVRILVAEDDLNFQQVIHDILEISFRDAHVERVMSMEALFGRLGDPDAQYALVLFNLHFDASEGTISLERLKERFPAILDRLVILCSSRHDQEQGRVVINGLPCIAKPFSLDEFTELVQGACVC